MSSGATTTFLAQDGAVCMIGRGGPVRLQPQSVEQLLEIFERERAVELFNALWCAREALRLQPVIHGTLDGWALVRGGVRKEFNTLDEARQALKAA